MVGNLSFQGKKMFMFVTNNSLGKLEANYGGYACMVFKALLSLYLGSALEPARWFILHSKRGALERLRWWRFDGQKWSFFVPIE